MSIRTDLSATRIPLKSSAWYTAILKDRLGVVIPSTALTSLTLTLYALSFVPTPPGTYYINNRNAQNVLNANGVTLDVNGNLTWAISPLDTVILEVTASYEYHVALFQWVGPDVGTGKQEVTFCVERIAEVL